MALCLEKGDYIRIQANCSEYFSRCFLWAAAAREHRWPKHFFGPRRIIRINPII